MSTGESVPVSLNLGNATSYNALQFDMTFPAGLDVTESGSSYSVSLNPQSADASHSIDVNKLSNGSYRKDPLWSGAKEIRAIPTDIVMSLPEEAVCPPSTTRSLFITLNDGIDYSSLLFDLALPKNLTLVDAVLSQDGAPGHTLSQSLNQGKTRISVRSTAEEHFKSGERLIELQLKAARGYTGGNLTFSSLSGNFRSSNIQSSVKNYTVEIPSSIKYGDSNGDGVVDISDVVNTIGYILERNPEKFRFARADVDCNERINVIDVVGTVDLILGNVAAGLPATPRRIPPVSGLALTDFKVCGDDKAQIGLSVSDSLDLTAIQFQLDMPDGLSVDDVTLSSGLEATHSLSFRNAGDHTTCVVVYSTSLSKLRDMRHVVDITLRSDPDFEHGTIFLNNARGSKDNAESISLGAVSVDVDAWSIAGMGQVADDSADVCVMKGGIAVTASPGEDITVYDMHGLPIRNICSSGQDHIQLPDGLYIVRAGGHAYKVGVVSQ